MKVTGLRVCAGRGHCCLLNPKSEYWRLILLSPSHQLVFVILALLTGVLCSYPNPMEDTCPGNYTNPLKVQTVIILGKVILWILYFLLEQYVQYHHCKVRNRGYNKIYRSTRHLKRLPLMIHSTGKFSCLPQLFGSLLEWHKWQQNKVFDFISKYMLLFLWEWCGH